MEYRPILGYSARFAVIVLAYVVAGRLGLSLSLVKESVTPIWPPTGIALAAVLLLGYRYAPAIFVGALLVNIKTGVPFSSTIGISIGNMLEAYAGAFFLNRAGFRKNLAGVEDVFKLLALGACVSTLFSATIGCASLFFGGVIRSDQLMEAFQVWWLGDMTGAIWMTPILLVWATRGKRAGIHWPEFAGLCLLLLLTSYAIFLVKFNYTYALFPLILLASMRFTTIGAAAAGMIVSTVSVLMTILGNGPFTAQSDRETLWLLNLFIGSTSLTGFIVAAVINDRSHAQSALLNTNIELEKRVAERTQVLERARAEAVQAEQRAWFMAETSAVLASSLDYETTLRSLTKAAVPFLGDCCVIDLIDAENNWKRVEVVHKDPEREKYLLQLKTEYLLNGDSKQPVSQVVQTGKPQLIRELTDEVLSDYVKDRAHFDLIRRIGLRSNIAVPMFSGTKIIGVIGVSLVDPGRNYGEADVLLAQEFAKHATLAVQNARLYNELQQANRFKDEFLATISHELRTPLTIILGWAKTLGQLEDRLSDDMKIKALQTIIRSAELQTQIVDDLLDISRVRTGKFKLQLSTFSLPQILNSAVDAIRPAASAKNIHIDTRLDPGVDSFYGDQDRLHQIVWNLISNAVKFTKEGGRIEIAAECGNQCVTLRFSDNGKGISNEFLPYVFQRFRQEDSSFTRKHGGLGLGLSIVKHLTELHGGTASVESQGEGKGTTFILNFPQRHGIVNHELIVPLTDPHELL